MVFNIEYAESPFDFSTLISLSLFIFIEIDSNGFSFKRVVLMILSAIYFISFPILDSATLSSYFIY
ncbi:MAG: hypothetical protein ACI8ZF_001000, partial [Candidatus Midichloriaceae bacterium]